MLVDISEAKARLCALLEKAQAGEEVVIARAGKPIARLTPIAPAPGTRSGVRFGGLTAARLKLAADFHAPPCEDDLLGASAGVRRIAPPAA
jgi:prevent-host-death family protein